MGQSDGGGEGFVTTSPQISRGFPARPTAALRGGEAVSVSLVGCVSLVGSLVFLVVTGVAAAVSAYRPGTIALTLHRAATVLAGPLLVSAAVVCGLLIDAPLRSAVTRLLTKDLPPHLLPVWHWLVGPALPRDLLAVAALATVLLVDAWEPDWRHHLTWTALRRAGSTLSTGTLRLLRAALPALVLLIGWIDVFASVAGFHTQAWYTAAERARFPLPGSLSDTPHPHLTPLMWWLAAVVLSHQGAHLGRSVVVALVGAALATVARPLAELLALPAFGVAACAHVLWPVLGSRYQGHLPAPHLWPWAMIGGALMRVALLAILGGSIAARWYHWPPELIDDAGGFGLAARLLHERAAERGWNEIALTFLDLHPYGREPFFMVVLRAAFDLMGESNYHQKTVTFFAGTAAIWLTYRFGRAALGRAEGLLAALLLAMATWFTIGSYQGLREEVALLLVYGLALLVLTSPRATRVRVAAAGLLAGAAVLTRLDAAGSVAFLLLFWAWQLWRTEERWRRTVGSWAILGTLVTFMCLGFQYRFGDFLAPVRGTMGQDIHALVDPLFRLEVSPGEVARRFWQGSLEIYGGIVFGELNSRLEPALGPMTRMLWLVIFAAGLVGLTRRGWRRNEPVLVVPVALALIAAYFPPYAYNASFGLYPDRYAYQLAPAAYCVFSWTLVQAARWLAHRLPSLRERRALPLVASSAAEARAISAR